jgi:mono/diheme cytochrome c family protein
VISDRLPSSARIGPQQGFFMPSINLFAHIGCAAALAVTLLAQQAFAADASNGRRLAARWCEACHVISATQHRASIDAVPPFATIAARPGFDAGKIALFLLDPHPKMPDMSLTRVEAADLAAYIATLAP